MNGLKVVVDSSVPAGEVHLRPIYEGDYFHRKHAGYERLVGPW